CLEQERPADVGAVGVAYHVWRCEAVGGAGVTQKGCKSGSLGLQIVQVPGALRAAAEKSDQPALDAASARRQQRRAGCNPFGQGQEVGLVAAGAMQKQQRRPCGVGTGNEAMDEPEVG